MTFNFNEKNNELLILYPEEYSIWMSATVAFSFTWINFLVLYKNDHLFLQSVTISVINNSSFFDMLISYGVLFISLAVSC
jgi:hypothetical protein